MKTYITVTTKIEILPTTTCILDTHQFGCCEATNFSRYYTHPTKQFIEIINVRQNPRAKDIFFMKIKHKKDLAAMVGMFNRAEGILKDDMKRNEFAVQKFQVSKK